MDFNCILKNIKALIPARAVKHDHQCHWRARERAECWVPLQQMNSTETGSMKGFQGNPKSLGLCLKLCETVFYRLSKNFKNYYPKPKYSMVFSLYPIPTATWRWFDYFQFPYNLMIRSVKQARSGKTFCRDIWCVGFNLL